MAKRFVKYETENPVGVNEEGVLTGNGGGSEIRLYVKYNNDYTKELFWDIECTQKLTANDIISLAEKVRDILIIFIHDDGLMSYSSCANIFYDNNVAGISNRNDVEYQVYR